MRVNLFYSDGQTSVWREPRNEYYLKNLTLTVKYGGGSVMVWYGDVSHTMVLED